MNRYIIIIIAAVLASCSPASKMSDKLEGNWIEVMPFSLDVVEGVTLEPGGIAKSIGMATLQYERWESKDSTLILWGKSIGNGQTIDFSDTLKIISISEDSLSLEKFGRYRFNYYKVPSFEDMKPFDVRDSLWRVDHTSEIETRVYNGVIPNQSCVELKHSLTIYNYKGSGDGVYKLTTTFGSFNEKSSSSNSYGRVYTLRGDKENIDATTYELIPFGGGENLYFRYQSDSLVVLNKELEHMMPSSIFKEVK